MIVMTSMTAEPIYPQFQGTAPFSLLLLLSFKHWLIGRNEDASKKIFLATGILVFDFEFFIGERDEFSGYGL